MVARELIWAFVLLLTFGSLIGVGLPILTALAGLGTGLGVIALSTHVVDTPNFSSELAAMIGLGVGIDYALFILTRFREAYVTPGTHRSDKTRVKFEISVDPSVPLPGFVLKRAAGTDLLPAVREVMRGGTYVCAPLRDQFAKGAVETPTPTEGPPRE